MEAEKKIMGRYPLCGGSIAKTYKDCRCKRSIGDNPSCVPNINGIIGSRKTDGGEVAELLGECHILLDGLVIKEGKTFPTVFELADDGAVNIRPVISKCPHCGGDIRVGSRAFNRPGYGDQEKPCSFVTWCNTGGHQVTFAEATDVCERDIAVSELEMYRDNSPIYRK